MNITQIIKNKRDNIEISKKEWSFIITNYINGTIKDYHMSSLLMAIYFNGLNTQELNSLVYFMKNSGDLINTSRIKNTIVDKHSTGGVGDGISLILAPLLACFNLSIPLMCGKALGHTGGTIDKFESIKGFITNRTNTQIIKQINKINVSVFGQSYNIVPADKLLYALRDVTGTVESLELIAASIMSKKLSVNPDILLLDIKVGSGAFIKTLRDGKKLAKLMLSIAASHKVKAKAILSYMDEPLGQAIGNSLEILQAIYIMQNRTDFDNTIFEKYPKDFIDLLYHLGANILFMAGISKNLTIAKKMIQEKFKSFEVLNKFKDLVIAQGGNPKIIENPEKLLPISKKIVKIRYKGKTKMFLSKINTELIGHASNILGAGRNNITDSIDHSTGIIMLKKVGDSMFVEDTLAKFYISDNSNLKEAKKLFNTAIHFSKTKIKKNTGVIC